MTVQIAGVLCMKTNFLETQKTETTVFVMCGQYEFVQDHKKGIYAADAKFSAVEIVQN